MLLILLLPSGHKDEKNIGKERSRRDGIENLYDLRAINLRNNILLDCCLRYWKLSVIEVN
jgi:hypothetical protein